MRGRKGIVIRCAVCGKRRYVKPSLIGRKKYCGQRCNSMVNQNMRKK